MCVTCDRERPVSDAMEEEGAGACVCSDRGCQCEGTVPSSHWYPLNTRSTSAFSLHSIRVRRPLSTARHAHRHPLNTQQPAHILRLAPVTASARWRMRLRASTAAQSWPSGRSDRSWRCWSRRRRRSRTPHRPTPPGVHATVMSRRVGRRQQKPQQNLKSDVMTVLTDLRSHGRSEVRRQSFLRTRLS